MIQGREVTADHINLPNRGSEASMVEAGKLQIEREAPSLVGEQHIHHNAGPAVGAEEGGAEAEVVAVAVHNPA